MPKNVFLPLFLLLLLSTTALAATETVESADLVMVVEKIGEKDNEGIRLVSLTDKVMGHVFCSMPSRPLFSLILCDPTIRKELYVLADSGWSSVHMEKQGNVLHLSWKGRTRLPGGDNVAVAMQITADPHKDGIEISQTAAAGSEQVSIIAMRLGQIAVRDFGSGTKVFLPLRSGMVYSNPCEKNTQLQSGYPGYQVPMPWCAVWDEKTPECSFRNINNIGLYVGFHDSADWPRRSRKDDGN